MSKPTTYDPALGKAALAALAPRLDSLRPDELVSTRADIEKAALAALAASTFANEPALHARFHKQDDAGEFDLAKLDSLPELSFAVLFALGEWRTHRDAVSEAKIPATLVAEATTLESRMQDLCEYHFRDDPAVRAELDRLRPGGGYSDLADDLLGYARIYEEHLSVVAANPKHYRPTDIDDARRIAGELLAALSTSMSPKARKAHDTLARAFTLLHRAYEDVRAVGLYLLRNDPASASNFPSLFTAARRAPRARKATATQSPADQPA